MNKNCFLNEAGANPTDNGGKTMSASKSRKSGYDHVIMDFASVPGQNSHPRITVLKQKK
jgi:hypothetical protein